VLLFLASCSSAKSSNWVGQNDANGFGYLEIANFGSYGSQHQRAWLTIMKKELTLYYPFEVTFRREQVKGEIALI
jgi:hypothetical protein